LYIFLFKNMPVVIVWWLDLQLPMLSVSITNNVWVRTSFRRDVLDTILCDKVCQWLEAGRWFSPGTPVSSTNKTDHHDIVETLLKVPLNNINQTKPILYHLLLKWRWQEIQTIHIILNHLDFIPFDFEHLMKVNSETHPSSLI
jgi:hypothetical protein